MNHLLVLGITAIVVLAIALVSTSGRHRQAGLATGQLSRETLRRDAVRRHGPSNGIAVEHASPAPVPAVVPIAASPTIWVPPDADAIGVTRRQFLNRSIVTFLGLSIASFSAAAFTAFLWPPPASGFGGVIRLGKISDLLDNVKKNGGFYYVPDGRMWVTAYPPEALAKAQIAYKDEGCLPGMEAGVNCLYQKCVHLGCRVPACLTSQWFECPCHGSQYNRVGEKRGGPAPRGLDRFPVTISSDGTVTADTASAKLILGPPIGTDTTGQQPEGPHCV